MIVRTAVLCSHSAAELAHSQLVADFCLHCSPRTNAYIDVSSHSVLFHASCDDVYHTAHGIAAVEHRGRTSQHFHTLHHHGLI